MNDPLERELASFRPRPPSPRWENALHDRLDGGHRRLFQAASVALVAASLLLALLGTRSPSPRSATGTVSLIDESLPTFQAYHQGLTDSPAELDALLRSRDREPGAGAPQTWQPSYRLDLDSVN